MVGYMIIKICGKTSDLFSANLIGNDGLPKGEPYDGYVPEFMPGDHYGDYVMMDIDVATGHILNWKTPTSKQLAKTFQFKRGVSVPKPV
jgi:hypothetical protein